MAAPTSTSEPTPSLQRLLEEQPGLANVLCCNISINLPRLKRLLQTRGVIVAQLKIVDREIRTCLLETYPRERAEKTLQVSDHVDVKEVVEDEGAAGLRLVRSGVNGRTLFFRAYLAANGRPATRSTWRNLPTEVRRDWGNRARDLNRDAAAASAASAQE